MADIIVSSKSTVSLFERLRYSFMTEQYITNSPEETEAVASELAVKLKSGDFIAFFGGLGMGKTAFVRGLASKLCEKARVTSPTFAIVNEYRGKLPIFHFDMYRIKDDEDLYSTGFYEYMERNGVIVTEWSENIEYALPEKRYEILFERLGEQTRRITITSIE